MRLGSGTALGERDARTLVLALIALGTLVRVLWAATTTGQGFDMGSFSLAAAAVLDDPPHLYGDLNPENTYRWPYPPGYLPWLAVVEALAVPVRFFAPLPATLADAAIAWLLWLGLGRAGLAPGARAAGAALVAVGPTFMVIAGIHGQIDAVAVLPALVAVLVWERGGDRRALAAGLLLGVAASIKVVPAITLLALLPSARGRGESVRLIAYAAAVPGLMLVPFLAADAPGVVRALGYAGMPGMGGISLLAQPGLPEAYLLGGSDVVANGVIRFLLDFGGILTGIALLAAAALAHRRRLGPRDAAVLVWATFLVAGTAFAHHYVVGVAVFLVLAGHLRAALGLQLALIGPALIFYAGPYPEGTGWVKEIYAAAMLVAWAGMVAVLVAWLRRTATDRTPRPSRPERRAAAGALTR